MVGTAEINSDHLAARNLLSPGDPEAAVGTARPVCSRRGEDWRNFIQSFSSSPPSPVMSEPNLLSLKGRFSTSLGLVSPILKRTIFYSGGSSPCCFWKPRFLLQSTFRSATLHRQALNPLGYDRKKILRAYKALFRKWISYEKNILLCSSACDIELFEGFFVNLLSFQVLRLLELLFVEDNAYIMKII